MSIKTVTSTSTAGISQWMMQQLRLLSKSAFKCIRRKMELNLGMSKPMTSSNTISRKTCSMDATANQAWHSSTPQLTRWSASLWPLSKQISTTMLKLKNRRNNARFLKMMKLFLISKQPVSTTLLMKTQTKRWRSALSTANAHWWKRLSLAKRIRKKSPLWFSTTRSSKVSSLSQGKKLKKAGDIAPFHPRRSLTDISATLRSSLTRLSGLFTPTIAWIWRLTTKSL